MAPYKRLVRIRVASDGRVRHHCVGWRAIFLVNVPLGIVNILLALRYLPRDQPVPTRAQRRFDPVGTVLLALTLAAYALAMTLGGGHWGQRNITLLVAAGFGAGLFVLVQSRVSSPLIALALFRNPVLSASLAMSMLVSSILMATLVIGPFYLAHGLGLKTALVGLVLSAGPLVSALTGVPAGRVVDRFGAQRMTLTGLIGIACGTFVLSRMPASFGIAGYLAPIVLTTASYALFQAANNTVIMTDVRADQRGVISGMLSLSRNLGLIAGASLMGAVFAMATASTNITLASPTAVTNGMHTAFAVAFGLIVFAMIIALASRALAPPPCARLTPSGTAQMTKEPGQSHQATASGTAERMISTKQRSRAG